MQNYKAVCHIYRNYVSIILSYGSVMFVCTQNADFNGTQCDLASDYLRTQVNQ